MPTVSYASTDRLLDELRLNTVCRGAKCPNIFECYNRKTATFMVLGNTCTRGCTFCAVGGGKPETVDPDEPRRVSEAAKRLGLRHVVVTSVTRDDLPDGGAEHFAETIRRIRGALDCTIEVLTPDFKGDTACIDVVVKARPDVFNHNIETVPRLYDEVRPGADYRRSLDFLRHVADAGVEKMYTKSGLMLGLGESDDEIRTTLEDLHEAGCRIVTIGQYLAPSNNHHPVAKYYTPEEFEEWKNRALKIGFSFAHSGPFVRSSYMAESVFEKSEKRDAD